MIQTGLETAVRGLQSGSGSICVYGILFGSFYEAVFIVGILHKITDVDTVAFRAAFLRIGAVEVAGDEEVVALGKGVYLFGKLCGLGCTCCLILCQSLIAVILPVGVENEELCVGILVLQLDPVESTSVICRIAVALTATAD